MTKLLDQAIERIRTLPSASQDDVARVLLRLAGDEDLSVYQLTPEEEADLIEADAEIARGEIATEEQILAVWAKYPL